MERQRNIPRIKEQEKSPEKELNEREASNLPDVELKKIVIKILKELNENAKKKTESIKK